MDICPFCKQEAIIYKEEYWPNCAKIPHYYYRIGCRTKDCYCFEPECVYNNIKEAISEWNKRE
jgi:hypothetical protein